MRLRGRGQRDRCDNGRVLDVITALVPPFVVGGAFIALLVMAFRATDGNKGEDPE